jgi:hypothetical protein
MFSAPQTTTGILTVFDEIRAEYDTIGDRGTYQPEYKAAQTVDRNGATPTEEHDARARLGWTTEEIIFPDYRSVVEYSRAFIGRTVTRSVESTRQVGPHAMWGWCRER